jgi:hypothetical protein
MSLSNQLPTFLRLGRFLLKWFLRGCFALVCLATLLALVIAEENFRGRRAWENYKQQAVARGEKLTVPEQAPPPVPDDQNFYMTPLLRPYITDRHYSLHLDLDLPGKPNSPNFGDWHTGTPTDLKAWRVYLGQPDILSALKKFSAPMDEIAAAAQRPYARYPVDYSFPATRILLPDIGAMLSLSNVFELRALAELDAGQTDSALSDTVTLFQLAHATQDDPLLISQLTSAAVLNRAMQVLWEGLAAHRWNDSQLAALQAELPRVNLLPGLLRSMHGERAMLVSTYEKLADQNFVQRAREIKAQQDFMTGPGSGTNLPIPRAILYQNMLNACLYDDQYVFPAINVSEQRFFPAISKAGVDAMSFMHRSTTYHDALLHPYYVFVALLVSTWNPVMMTIARAQTSLDEASLACALERFRLAHGHYPDSLDTLVPQFIAQLPHDVISGAPLHYQRTADGRFLLYSVGWNETDDHGLVVKYSDGSLNPNQGDWVWPAPPL